jgi:hypothetical protein
MRIHAGARRRILDGGTLKAMSLLGDLNGKEVGLPRTAHSPWMRSMMYYYPTANDRVWGMLCGAYWSTKNLPLLRPNGSLQL